MVTHGKGGVYWPESHKEKFRLIELLYILIQMVVSWVYIVYVKSHTAVQIIFCSLLYIDNILKKNLST